MDIRPGDTVEVTSNYIVLKVDVPIPFTALLDADADTISGEAPIGMELLVMVEDEEMEVTAIEHPPGSGSGTWTADFHGIIDLIEEDEGVVFYFVPDVRSLLNVRVRFCAS